MIRLLAAVLAVLWLGTACSRVDWGWRLAPWYLEREGARWLGLSGTQRDAFGRDARAWLQEQRSQSVPALAALADTLASDLEQGADEQALDDLFVRLPALWDQIAGSAVPAVTAWLGNEPQARADALQANFERRQRRRQAEPERNEADPASTRRHQRLRQNLADWIGPLSPQQEEGLRAWAHERAFPSQAWRADRHRRQEALLGALRGGADAGKIEALLRAWWIQPELDRDPAYQQALTSYRQRVRIEAARLLASLSPGQRERLARRVKALAQDLHGIVQRSQVHEKAQK